MAVKKTSTTPIDALRHHDKRLNIPAEELRDFLAEDEAACATLYSTRSTPFGRPASGKIAVKVINHYGDEVSKVYDV